MILRFYPISRNVLQSKTNIVHYKTLQYVNSLKNMHVLSYYEYKAYRNI